MAWIHFFPMSFVCCIFFMLVPLLATAQDGVCRTLVSEDKSDGSLIGPYHNFSVSCINDSFALLNVRETDKRDYKSVTVEMKCTNEILNTSYSRILLYQYSPRSERNISVHYNTNLEPGTSCVFSGCVRTGPAENNVYKYNIQEATCNQSIDNWRSSSSMTIDSTSMISPSPSPLPSSTSTDSTPSSSLSLIYGISESNFMINIPTKTVSNNGGSLTAGIGISNILLPTCSLDSSMLARSMLVVCVILAVAIIVFGAIIIIFAFALCHIRSRQVFQSEKNVHMESAKSFNGC
ncbi:PREDICTED: uncharacterized protein LOC109590074 [Amphimedon queenslandica]|uniref:CUB domain-containing protein n=1 Tax=Amphimedon queenslandica TaxID=400682 RepID=A0AAN0JWL5_AMPQE|nr:PREDICTED: uncharacterized protein LOC109590074 [Amphimedon queenslandica]|eukprot:XP_019861579.1 PREDICTED: uncharacterized protein LOC109590074 [Amphimedon queenslandica]